MKVREERLSSKSLTSTDVVIQVEDLWKQYRLGAINHGMLSRDLQSWWARIRGKDDPNLPLDLTPQRVSDSTVEVADRFWALRNVSFEVKRGEIVGIIGRNGAGKSTLLKILSQVTTPTKGEVRINGRIASLLEVGTGFHPELTGRENIFLNGAILGMSKAEIARKFDEIVDFSGIEKFIDTPVKRYSSGMFVRLAFAVAAHLEPEILIVDEVLAVGDAEFQKKCLGKMEEVGREGRTVLFVSHDMQAVSSLTQKVIFLKQGAINFIGNTFEGINNYLSNLQTSEFVYYALPEVDRPSITKVELVTSLPNNVQENGKEMKLLLNINMPKYEEGIAVAVHVKDLKGRGILHFSAIDSKKNICRKVGDNTVELIIPYLRMYMGRYNISVHLAQRKGAVKYETINDICPFEVVMYYKEHEYRWQEGICAYIEDYEIK